MIVVCGPTTEPVPIAVAPISEQPGSIRTSGSIATSASIQVDAGIDDRDAGEHVALEDLPAGLGLDEGEVDARVDAEDHVRVGGDVGGDVTARLLQKRQDVGEVVLALGVVVGEARQHGRDRPCRRRRRCRS